MKKLLSSVIIWGNDNYNVLGLLRQLTPYVSDVVFLANKNKGHCASKSVYCSRVVVAKTIDEALLYLNKVGLRQKKKTFLVTTSDLLASVVDNNKDTLSKYFILCTTSKQGGLTHSQNKNYQCALARKKGISVPASIEFKIDSRIDNIDYPCLIKPAFKQRGVVHPFKSCICLNENELQVVQKCLDKKGIYILQQLINKEKDLLVYGCRLPDGSVVYSGTFTKYRWSGGDGSYGTIESQIPACINTEKLNSFLEDIGYYGLFSAEFGVQDGIAWFYEFNLRNDGTSHYFYQAGLTNLPLLWVKYHLGEKIESSTKEVCSIFIDEIGDYENVKNGLITKSEWKKQRMVATIFKFFDQNDKWPYIYEKLFYLARRMYHIVKFDIFQR